MLELHAVVSEGVGVTYVCAFCVECYRSVYPSFLCYNIGNVTYSAMCTSLNLHGMGQMRSWRACFGTTKYKVKMCYGKPATPLNILLSSLSSIIQGGMRTA